MNWSENESEICKFIILSCPHLAEPIILCTHPTSSLRLRDNPDSRRVLSFSLFIISGCWLKPVHCPTIITRNRRWAHTRRDCYLCIFGTDSVGMDIGLEGNNYACLSLTFHLSSQFRFMLRQSQVWKVNS